MIIIAVQLYAVPGAVEAMRVYEDKALRIFRKYGGEVLAAFKPVSDPDGKGEPDEVQMLGIASIEAFHQFMNDPERLGLVEERNRVVKRAEVFISKEHIPHPA